MKAAHSHKRFILFIEQNRFRGAGVYLLPCVLLENAMERVEWRGTLRWRQWMLTGGRRVNNDGGVAR